MSIPPPPRIKPGIPLPARPQPPQLGTQVQDRGAGVNASAPTESKSVERTPRTTEPPYEIVYDDVPVLGIVMYVHKVRKGWFSVGWRLFELFDIERQINQSPQDGIGLYRDGDPEQVAYNQYFPNLPGGRL